MAPAILRHLLGRAVPVPDASALGPMAARAVLAGRSLLPRDEQKDEHKNDIDPSRGVIDPHNINNTFMFVLFGLIGGAFVIAGIWFFFWAKNGGIHFKEDDWEEYKSTVMRRKGPNGTILSNATPSTNLGGGSVYKDVDDYATTVSGSTNQQNRDRDDDGRTCITDSTYMTGITAGVSNPGAREKRRKKKEARDRERERRREEKEQAKRAEKAEKAERKSKKGRRVDANGDLIDEDAEAEAQEHLRSYRHEKPARVGGLNKEREGSEWDGSNPSASTAPASSAREEAESDVTSELLGGRQRTPTSTPTKKAGGIRKVYSTADRNAEREAERIRAEARRLQEKGRSHMAASSASGGSSSAGASPTKNSSAPRRDFSFQRADDSRRGPMLKRIEEAVPIIREDDRETRVPGSWTESDLGTGSDVGTKTYHHPIPELTGSNVSGSGVSSVSGVSTNDFAYQDEKRKQRRGGGAGAGAGYRRG